MREGACRGVFPLNLANHILVPFAQSVKEDKFAVRMQRMHSFWYGGALKHIPHEVVMDSGMQGWVSVVAMELFSFFFSHTMKAGGHSSRDSTDLVSRLKNAT